MRTYIFPSFCHTGNGLRGNAVFPCPRFIVVLLLALRYTCVQTAAAAAEVGVDLNRCTRCSQTAKKNIIPAHKCHLYLFPLGGCVWRWGGGGWLVSHCHQVRMQPKMTSGGLGKATLDYIKPVVGRASRRKMRRWDDADSRNVSPKTSTVTSVRSEL